MGWSPIPIDRGKPGSMLANWMQLPWGGPDSIILPGYHMHAENGFRTLGKARPGMDIFRSVCGLLSTGARTILISRWRTGGKTSFDLVREFTKELPHAPASESWQRAVMLSSQVKLRPEKEPRVGKPKGGESVPNASNPFFWSGYMLIDSGSVPLAKGDVAAK